MWAGADNCSPLAAICAIFWTPREQICREYGDCWRNSVSLRCWTEDNPAWLLKNTGNRLLTRAAQNRAVAFAIPCVQPGTWVTLLSGDIGNTFQSVF